MNIYTGDTFDLFHVGHVNLLRWCRELSGENGLVVVSLNTDSFIEKYKGSPPVINYEDREGVLLSCKYVDRVIPNTGGSDSKPAILEVLPDMIVIGSDWVKKDYYKQMDFTHEWLDDHNIGLIYVPYTEGISSTKIRKKICNI